MYMFESIYKDSNTSYSILLIFYLFSACYIALDRMRLPICCISYDLFSMPSNVCRPTPWLHHFTAKTSAHYFHQSCTLVVFLTPWWVERRNRSRTQLAQYIANSGWAEQDIQEDYNKYYQLQYLVKKPGYTLNDDEVQRMKYHNLAYLQWKAKGNSETSKEDSRPSSRRRHHCHIQRCKQLHLHICHFSGFIYIYFHQC